MNQRRTAAERRQAWEREYATKGEVWRGQAFLDLAIAAQARVLEAGCGNGKLLSSLLARTSSLVALDVSREALQIVRDRPGSERAHLLQADVVDLPFRDHSFDLIFCHHLLEHLWKEEREAAARELVRVLAPGGRVSFLAFSVGDMRQGKGEEVEPDTFLRSFGIPYHYFQEEEVRSLFSSLQMEEIRTETTARTYNGVVLQRSRVRALLHRP